MDAFPDYSKFDGTKKVLAIMQIVEADDDESDADDKLRSHPKQAESVPVENTVTENNFDHWKTYGELGRYAHGGETGQYQYTDAEGNASLSADSRDHEINTTIIKKN